MHEGVFWSKLFSLLLPKILDGMLEINASKGMLNSFTSINGCSFICTSQNRTYNQMVKKLNWVCTYFSFARLKNRVCVWKFHWDFHHSLSHVYTTKNRKINKFSRAKFLVIEQYTYSLFYNLRWTIMIHSLFRKMNTTRRIKKRKSK